MASTDEIRDAQRAAWAGLSAGWEKWDSVIMDQLAPVGAAMIERLDIAEDQQHLDIAAGTGEPGLSIARLAPRGRVVLTDLAADIRDGGLCGLETGGVNPLLSGMRYFGSEFDAAVAPGSAQPAAAAQSGSHA